MSESKIYTIPDGGNSLDPNLMLAFAQLINTISHEYYHLICHISKALDIEDEEKLAYLNGFLNMQSYIFIEKLKCKVDS